MKNIKCNWMNTDYEWESFEDTDTYKEYQAREKKNANIPAQNGKMDMKVHNKLKINYKKTINLINFLVKASLGKFAKKNKWKVEVWLDEKNSKASPEFSCGVSLVRPKKQTIYAKKVAGSLNEAVRKSVGVIENSIRNEGSSWSRSVTI